MTRINLIRKFAGARSLAWGRVRTWGTNAGALIFAAVLIICSVTVGCSSDKPKTVNASNQTPIAPPVTTSEPAPVPVAQTDEAKPVPRKVQHKKPATSNFTDKTYGVSFEYPRRYAIETGDAATQVLGSHPIAMNFVQPGGVALAAVELPETGYTTTDFSSAFFNVSVNKGVTADQCSEFAVPQVKAAVSSTTESAPAQVSSGLQTSSTTDTPAKSDSASGSKLMVGDLGLIGTEAVAGEGTRQSDSKYFHVFQNGACYEFALNVTTVASGDGVIKHVNRDKVFSRLEQILDTVKINPVAAPEQTAEAPTPVPSATPAQ